MKYLEEDFNTMIRRSIHYSQKEQDTSANWLTLQSLYKKNYVDAADTTEKIPRKLHQIWLGGELPDKFKKYVDTWRQLHPAWEYKMWTDADIDNITIERRDVFNVATNLGQKSDILRYEILRQQGGIYVDTDFECLKPLDDLLYLDFFTGITTDADAQLYIGILGSVPDHPVMNTCARSLKPYAGNDGNGVMDATGPFYFTRCFFSSVGKDTEGVVAFPMAFFYPFPNHLRFTEDARKYILPASYAVHHWKTSWLYK
jgi:mannosyltransferase OCH1-like enzyme